MTYKLRDYQKEATVRAVNFFRSEKIKGNAFMVLPTGSGKSLVIAAIAKALNEPTIIFQPTKEILEQNFAKLHSYGIWDIAVYSASFNSKEINRITFATIGSVKNKADLFKHFKNVIIDECHYCNPKQGMYKKFLDQLNGSKVLGLTATPYRLSSNSLGSQLKFLSRTRPRVFSHLIYFTQVSELAKRGYLSKVNYYNVKGVDVSKLISNSTGADYTDKSLKRHYEEIGFNGLILNVIDRLIAVNRKNILVFTKFVEEAQFIADQRDCVEIVTGETPKAERERILNEYKSGKIKVIVNVGVLTVGFDFPELETIVLARPTKSLALYYQMVGRGIRPHPDKKETWVIDLCQNYRRFGKVEDLKIDAVKSGLWYIRNHKEVLTNVYLR